MLHLRGFAAIIGLLLLRLISAIQVDFTNQDSIKSAASTVAYGMVSYYKGNESGQTPGLLPKPYYWWEAGAMFGALLNYWHTTGDETYNSITMQGLQFQVGPGNDYQPPNETASLGNDDQAFWAIAAMAAAEYKFPDPPNPKDPSWLGLAQAVFNEQVARWDTTTCGGGIAWQVPPWNPGYNLKNSISNGCLFQIAARLARYTSDDLYAQWTEKIWDWFLSVGLMTPHYAVYDNSEWRTLNCSQVDKNQWIYNAATMLVGSAYMYNYTNASPVWQTRVEGLLDAIIPDYFNDRGVMTDICEHAKVGCNVDQRSFKAYAARWMSATTQLAPFTYDKIMPVLLSSAQAAAAQCTGGPSGNACGQFWWNNGTWDGTDGVGQQMSALEVMLGTLVQQASPPVTNSTGGTSTGNPNAGNNTATLPGLYTSPATEGDKVGAWLLTVIILLAMLWTTYFLWSEALERRSGTRRRAREVLAEKGMGLNEKRRGSKGKGRVREWEAESMILQPPSPSRSAIGASNRRSRVKTVSWSQGIDDETRRDSRISRGGIRI